MVTVKYIGHSSFYLKGEEFSVVLDPFSSIGYEMPNISADFCVSSHGHFDHNNFYSVNSKREITDSYGAFRAVKTFHDECGGAKRGDNNVFVFTLDGITFCHMGDIGQPLDEKIVKEIGKVDVLFLPVGGTYTIDAKEAFKYAKAINPKIVVPMHFKTANSNIDVAGPQEFLDLVEDFESVGDTFTLKEVASIEKFITVLMNID